MSSSAKCKVEWYRDNDDGSSETFVVEGSVSPVIQGKYWGPPERCYPTEGGEVEIETITRNGVKFAPELFTPDELGSMEQQLADFAGSADDFDDDPWTNEDFDS